MEFGGSTPPRVANIKLGFLVVTVLTMVSKLQDSSNKPQMDSGRLNINWRDVRVVDGAGLENQ